MRKASFLNVFRLVVHHVMFIIAKRMVFSYDCKSLGLKAFDKMQYYYNAMSILAPGCIQLASRQYQDLNQGVQTNCSGKSHYYTQRGREYRLDQVAINFVCLNGGSWHFTQLSFKHAPYLAVQLSLTP